MIADRISLAGIEKLTEGLSGEEASFLLDPKSDPARRIPDFPEFALRDVQSDLPSVEKIEEALIAHVRGEAQPRDLIASLFHPFVDPRFIDLDPGKGQKRPSYALAIPLCGLTLPRASTASIAASLHERATLLSRYAVGDRTPEGGPELLLNIRGMDRYPSIIRVKAESVATVRAAYHAAFGRMPDAILLPVPMTASEVLPHVLAARQVLASGAIGAPRLREKAVALIAAAEDLRAVASIVLRRHPDVSSFERFSIEIALDGSFTITATDESSDRNSSHAEMQFLARYRDLFEALKKTAARHQVLREMPKHCALRMRGTSTYLDFSVINQGVAQDNPAHKTSRLDYEETGDLAEWLSEIETPASKDPANWKLSLSDGRFRSKREWQLHGETLAHAIAAAVEVDTISSSMTLMDLAIDLMAEEDGAEPKVTMHRVL